MQTNVERQQADQWMLGGVAWMGGGERHKF